MKGNNRNEKDKLNKSDTFFQRYKEFSGILLSYKIRNILKSKVRDSECRTLFKNLENMKEKDMQNYVK